MGQHRDNMGRGEGTGQKPNPIIMLSLPNRKIHMTSFPNHFCP